MTASARSSSSSSIRVEGWKVEARDSVERAGPFSTTTAGTPARASTDAATMPTGPAPTMTNGRASRPAGHQIGGVEAGEEPTVHRRSVLRQQTTEPPRRSSMPLVEARATAWPC